MPIPLVHRAAPVSRSNKGERGCARCRLPSHGEWHLLPGPEAADGSRRTLSADHALVPRLVCTNANASRVNKLVEEWMPGLFRLSWEIASSEPL